MNLAKHLAIATIILTLTVTNVSADVLTTGDVVGDPVTSTSSTNLTIGAYEHGTMTIDSNGSDHDVYCQSTTVGWRPGSSGDVLVVGSGSTWTLSGPLYVGSQGDGTLAILNGGAVSGGYSSLGYASGTTGTITVDGPGSTWHNTLANCIGYAGNGTLNILNGGIVYDSQQCYVGNSSTSNSALSVVGSGSILYANGGLDVGRNGATGTLHIAQGGKIDAGAEIKINADSTATIDVSNDDMLIAGGSWGGWLTNNGTIRMTAGPQLSAGVYRPILVEPDPGGCPGFWEGSGVYEAIGGVWDSSAHTFTVSAALTTGAGTTTPMDLSIYQRLNVGSDLTVNFQSGPEISFSAKRSTSTLAGLLGSLGEDESVLSSWDFTITGLDAGSKTMLSYAVTGDPSDVRVWRYDGSVWSEYTGSHVYVEDGHATFIVDGFSSYAVTGVAPIPEPSTLVLLVTAVGGLALLRRRRRR